MLAFLPALALACCLAATLAVYAIVPPSRMTATSRTTSPFNSPSPTSDDHGAPFAIFGPPLLNPDTAAEFGTALDWNSNYELLGVGATRSGGSKQGTVFVYNASSFEPLWSLVGNENEQIGGQFSLSNNKIAISRQSSIEIRNAYTGALVGDPIPSEKANDIAFVNDDLLFIGEDRFDTRTGRLRILNYNDASDQWDDLESISSSFPEGRFGWVVSSSTDGSRVAISAPNAKRDSYRQGYATVFEREEVTGSWTQLGDSLFGTATSGQFGFSMAMSGDGSLIVVGSQGMIDGAVAAFRFSEGAWEQVGKTMYSKVVGERFGRSVAVSQDGTRVAVTSFLFDEERGHVRIFDFMDGNWSPLQEVEGDNARDRFGIGLNGFDLSDGSILTVGVVLALNGIGEVKFVDLQSTLEEEGNASPSSSPTTIMLLESTMPPSVSSTDAPTVSVDMAPTEPPTVNTDPPSSAPSRISAAPSTILVGSAAPTARSTSSQTYSTGTPTITPQSAPSGAISTLPSVANDTFTIHASSSLGFDSNQEFGSLVDFNSNRALLAVGAPKFGSMNQGSVFVYNTESYDFLWSTTGDSMNEAVGSRVSMSKTMIAIGRRNSIEIRNAYTGVLIGKPIPAGKGKDVVLVNDDLLIIGEDRFNDRTGRVRILSHNVVTDQWDGVLAIPGFFSEGRFGWVVSASVDGSRVAFSAPNAGRDSYRQGYVTVLERDSIDGSWTQLGDSLFGTAVSGQFGFSLAISGDGSTLVVGSQGTIDGALAAFRFGQGVWKQVGSTIYSKVVGERFGRSVAISHDATRIAATSSFFDEERGHARIFDLVGNDWSPVHEVEGDSTGAHLGLGLNGLDLSPDGSTLTVGVVSASSGAGEVKVVSLEGTSEDTGTLSPSVSPDASTAPPSTYPTLFLLTTTNPTVSPIRAPTAPPAPTPKNPPTPPPTPKATALRTAPPTPTPKNLPTPTPNVPSTSVPSSTPKNPPSAPPTAPPSATSKNPPTFAPAAPPTVSPTESPIAPPTSLPTNLPTPAPTNLPTDTPRNLPTTASPTTGATLTPTTPLTSAPIVTPSKSPNIDLNAPSPTSSSVTPAVELSTTSVPTTNPSAFPILAPSTSNGPTYSNMPSTTPSLRASTSPSNNDNGELLSVVAISSSTRIAGSLWVVATMSTSTVLLLSSLCL